MLQLSANGDYGLMLLRELSRLKPHEFISLGDLAKERKLPRRYLDYVAKKLVVADIITAREGRSGGYSLRRAAKEISFVEVLQALEGELEPVHCTHDGKCCDRQAACERKTGWQGVHKELYKLIEKKTLADVLKAAA